MVGPRDRATLAHVCALLSNDPNVSDFTYEDDPANPYAVDLRVDFVPHASGPSNPDLQRYGPATNAVETHITILAAEAARLEGEHQRQLDVALEDVSTTPEIPGWVRVGRWVRHRKNLWAARITEVVPGLTHRVRYTRDNGAGTVHQPAIVPLGSFVESFDPADKPLPPPTYYQRLLGRRS